MVAFGLFALRGHDLDAVLAEVCRDWEGATSYAAENGVRVVLLRSAAVWRARRAGL